MRILKSKRYVSHESLTLFINDNNIPREDILTIASRGDSFEFVVFFYGDSEIKEKERNFWGNLDE